MPAKKIKAKKVKKLSLFQWLNKKTLLLLSMIVLLIATLSITLVGLHQQHQTQQYASAGQACTSMGQTGVCAGGGQCPAGTTADSVLNSNPVSNSCPAVQFAYHQYGNDVCCIRTAVGVGGAIRGNNNSSNSIGGGGTSPYCGDGVCNNGETCGTCSRDCGRCGPPAALCGTCTPGAACGMNGQYCEKSTNSCTARNIPLLNIYQCLSGIWKFRYPQAGSYKNQCSFKCNTLCSCSAGGSCGMIGQYCESQTSTCNSGTPVVSVLQCNTAKQWQFRYNQNGSYRHVCAFTCR